MQIKDSQSTSFKYQGKLWVIDLVITTAANIEMFLITDVLSGQVKIVRGDIEVEPIQTVYTDDHENL